jgi:predicted membrane protein
MTAYTGGGNVFLDLAGMQVTRVSAETGGGNMEVILPEDITRLSLAAKSGAGNVVVTIPAGMAARIQANSGLGQVIIDPRYPAIQKNTFQSPDYPQAARRVEIIVSSGAGNVSIKERSVSPEPQLP